MNSDANTEATKEILLWGRGWDYQLANGSTDTISRPYKLNFNKQQSVAKIEPRLVSLGSKHTLMLDIDGNIWYWGKKSSVGIRDIEKEHQKYPKILLSATGSNDGGPFTHISSRHINNLATTLDGGIIAFGEEENKSGLKVEDSFENDKDYIEAKSGCRWRSID